MSYDNLRTAALQWEAIQRSRLALNGMYKAFARCGRPVPEAISDGVVSTFEAEERRFLRAVVADCTGEPWLDAVRGHVATTHGLGPTALCVVGLLPPLPAFANPGKMWKYAGLHVKPDGTAPRKSDAYDTEAKRPVFSPRLRSYVVQRLVDPIIKGGGPYRLVYDQRKLHTAVTHPEWATANPKAPKLHYQRDAMRYTGKRILRDLWRVAHGVCVTDPDPVPACL